MQQGTLAPGAGAGGGGAEAAGVERGLGGLRVLQEVEEVVAGAGEGPSCPRGSSFADDVKQCVPDQKPPPPPPPPPPVPAVEREAESHYGMPKDHPYTPPAARVYSALQLRSAEHYVASGGVLHQVSPLTRPRTHTKC